MFLKTTSEIFDNNKLLELNKILINELKKEKDYINIINVNKIKESSGDITLNEMSLLKDKNIKIFATNISIILEKLSNLLENDKICFEYTIEVLSNLKMGITQKQYENILKKEMESDAEDPKEIILNVINRINNLVKNYK